MKRKYDVIVVGARVAGAATAMLLARQGVEVLIVDSAEPGTDTLSTHALMRAGVMQLARWGILPAIVSAHTPPVHRTTFYYGEEAEALEISDVHGVDALYAPRRYLLDRVMAASCQEAGADIRFRTTFRDVVRDSSGRVTGALLREADGQDVEVAATFLVGADGRRSRVARCTGAAIASLARSSTALVYGYFPGLRNEGYRWYFGQQTAAGAIPTNDGNHCVFSSVPMDELRTLTGALGKVGAIQAIAERANPQFGEEIEPLSPVDPLAVFGGQVGFLRQAAGTGWALVGDAGYFKDPITAHGISDAFRDAEALSRAIILGSDRALAEYQTARNRLSKEFFQVTDTIASFEWSFDDLRAHHIAAHKSMKREQDWIADEFSGRPISLL